MHTFKRLISYSPYLLILLVVLPVFAEATSHDGPTFMKEMMWTFVNNIFGSLIGFAGILLDYAVNNYVIGFGETWGLNGEGVGGSVDLTWTIVRDVFNITFIFGLVWLGFKMILRSDDSNTRRTLITLIMAALLVNFSLFITKFVVDFTNILASEIALGFVDINNPASGNQASISSSFMQLFGLTRIFDIDVNATGAGSTLTSETTWMYIFGTAMIFLIGAFCFAAGAIMLIIRFAALCIYMVFSPLMFLGWVFPGLRSVSSKYWSGFLGRAFYAPAYMILIYLAAFVMGSYNESAAGFRAATGEFGFTGETFTAGNVAAIGGAFGPFALTVVFLIASVVVAGKMSADGASTAMKLGNNLRGRAQRGLKNGVVWSGRTASAPVRRAGRSLDNATGNKINSYLDRKQQEDGRILGFKARNYLVDDIVRGQAKKFKDSKNGESITADEAEKKQAAINSRAAADSDVLAGLEEMNKPETERNLAKIAKMQSAVSNLSQSRLESMTEKELLAITPYLKAGQFEKLMDSDNLNADKKDNIFKARREAIDATLQKTGASLREAVGKLSIKQIETLGAEWIDQNAHLLTKDQMDSVKKSDSFIEEQKGSFIGKRKSNMIRAAEKDDAIETLIEKQKPVEIAQYPAAVLTSSKIVSVLKPDVLKQIVKKDSITATEMNELRDKVAINGTTESKNYLKSPQGIKDWYDGKRYSTDATHAWDDPMA